MIPFKTLDQLFTKLKEVYGDSHCKKQIGKKFRRLKIGTRSFNAFYSEFIRLLTKRKFTKEMLL